MSVLCDDDSFYEATVLFQVGLSHPVFTTPTLNFSVNILSDISGSVHTTELQFRQLLWPEPSHAALHIVHVHVS